MLYGWNVMLSQVAVKVIDKTQLNTASLQKVCIYSSLDCLIPCISSFSHCLFLLFLMFISDFCLVV
jgi:hypothetical protein